MITVLWKGQNMEALRFTADLKTEPVIITVKGQDKDYEIREFDGNGRQEYMNGIMDVVDIGEVDTDGVSEGKEVGIQIKGFKGDVMGMQSKLVALCLFEKGAEETVPIETIQKFPVTTIAGLFKACQILNGLGKKAGKIAKND